MMVALAWVMALTLGPVLLTIMFVGSPPRLEQADRDRPDRCASRGAWTRLKGQSALILPDHRGDKPASADGEALERDGRLLRQSVCLLGRQLLSLV